MKTELTLGYSPYDAPIQADGIYPFHHTFDRALDLSKHDVEECDAILLWGGTDIHPDFYNRPMHRNSQAMSAPTPRDWFEWELMREARALNKPIIGICRGAQFLCAFAGGLLVQDCSGHHGHHKIITNTQKAILTTSSHHQMMYPWDVEHELLAWAENPLSQQYHGLMDEELRNMVLEPEVVWFPEVRGLAIQGHPEWMSESSEFVDWCNDRVLEYFFTK